MISRAVTHVATTPRVRRAALLASWKTVVPVGAAAAVFWLGYDGGAYSLQSWTKAAIVVWWTVLIGVVAGLLPRVRIGRAAIATVGLIAAFSVYTGLSSIWGGSAEAAVTAMARGLFYCGVLTLVLFLCTRSVAVRSSDGIAMGLVTIALLALASRFFPTIFSADRVLASLPDAHTRLNYPVAYWNGLAIMVGLATPLLLRAAVWGRSPLARAAALAPFPAIAAVMYLSSSRSGSVTVAVGAVAFVALCGRRWQAAGAVVLAAVGSILAVVVLRQLQALVNGPLEGSAAHSQGRTAALTLIGLALATAVCWRLIFPRLDRLKVSRKAGYIVVGVLLVVLVAGVAASGPVGRWHAFTQPPGNAATGQNGIQSHLFSVSGNWRWQYWQSAVDEWKTRPLTGRGAGSFAPWWSQHGDELGFIGNAHSLYAQTLGELGLIGFGLIVGGVVLGLVVGVRRALGMRGALGDAAAAATAGFAAYAVAAGIDWMWEVPAVSVVGFALLGLAVGPATGGDPAAAVAPWLGRGIRVAVAGAAAVVLLLELNVLVGDLKIGDSQAAAARGDLAAARRAAHDAHGLQPWAATPYLQGALVDEAAGRLTAAARSIHSAIVRDETNWQVWLIASRIQGKLGDLTVAHASYDRARALNPRSAAVAAAAPPAHSTAAPIATPTRLVTAIHDPLNFPGADGPVAFEHARATGAGVARILIRWLTVAPKEPSAAPRDPRNPAYDWASVDQQVTTAVRAGLLPMLDIYDPPRWAEKPGTSAALPELRNVTDLAAFARAAADRYSGRLPGLPRVRYWGVWNEPNVSYYLSPQYVNEKPVSPDVYRDMVNAFADSVHAVRSDNVVVAGDTSPFSQGDPDTNPARDNVAVAPLAFMRQLLCMSAGPGPQPTCDTPVRFDVWSHHPYTHGGPNDKADRTDNVSVGDLPAMSSLLGAAVKAGHVKSAHPVQFWVTEFSWDSNPTDPAGVPVRLEAQWVAEGLYQMWKAGVSLVTWYLVHDTAWRPNLTSDSFQSSLYQPGRTIAQDTPKPALATFRFPFVGHVVNGKVFVWGRTPWGRPGKVLVEQLQKGRWTRLGVVTTNRNGLLSKTFRAPTQGYVRARELRRGGLAAPPFPLAPLRDMDVQPFGS